MPVVEKILNDYLKRGIEGRDLQYAINILLNGGYKYGGTTLYASLPLSLSNLWKRVGEFCSKINDGKTL